VTTSRKVSVRLLALGGVVGPAAFVAAWAIGGATTSHYSSVDAAISDLAAVGSSARVGMTIGFVGFGFGLVAFGLALRDALDGWAWIAAVVTGVATIGVAATPLGGWSGDGVHAAFAGLGYVAIVALPLGAVRPLARGGRTAWSRASLVTAAASALCLVATLAGPAHGLWQRLGLTVADVWIVVAASTLVAHGTLVTRPADAGARGT
jgi:hypothetical membrane protein